MRIVVNDIAASRSGALSVLESFYHSVVESDKNNEWIFLLGGNYLQETDCVKVITRPDVKKSFANKLKFDFFEGKKFIEALKPDIVLSLQNIITFGLKVPQVVYVHQSIPFQSVKKFSFLKKEEFKSAVYQYLIGCIINHSIKKADYVIVQTEWMKQAVIRKSKISDQKICCIFPEIKKMEPAELIQFDSSGNSFFYPTSNIIYKNNDCIYEACKKLNDTKLYEYKVKLTLDSGPAIDNIEYAGWISEKNICQEYSKSILLFPSYIETVGLPLLEAKRQGGIIFASDCEYAREVLQGYPNAYFFPYDQPDQLANLMKNAIEQKILKKENSLNNQERENSWIQVFKILERWSNQR